MGTSSQERARLVERFTSGALRCLVSVGVLTTGFNAPGVDLIALMRPTQSPGLHVQQIGRGMRTAPGKSNCLILDFAGNVGRHGPIDAVRVKDGRQARSPGEAPVKTCPECRTIVHAAARFCDECGFDIRSRAIQISARRLLRRRC